ncbi:hypothetical protein HK100_007791 [Physocladia obscura]|uniref:DAGKc domain-containing protein n=1 Tax=Physocladia obscura TaxID=109957 RepID=A0AAD5T9I1_9FUNG|nr:hypothetical protein HK100_007791 [Physocladia obscura]
MSVVVPIDVAETELAFQTMALLVDIGQAEGKAVTVSLVSPKSSNTNGAGQAESSSNNSVNYTGGGLFTWTRIDDANNTTTTSLSAMLGWGTGGAGDVVDQGVVPASLLVAASIVHSSSTVTAATSCLVDVHYLHTNTPTDSDSNSNSSPTPPKNKPPLLKSVRFNFASITERDRFILALKAIRVPCKDFDALKEMSPRLPVYFFVNPFGGVKEAVKIFLETVVPLMDLAGIPYERTDTEYKGHAEEIMSTVDVRKYSAFIAVSGDGVLHEVINGLMNRRDWRAARRTLIGTVGAGSSNAMNPNLGHLFPVYGVLKTHRPMDIISCTFHNSGKVVYSHLNMAWAYIADLDIESDAFRWIGREKTTLSALNRLIRLRRYRGNIGIQPINHQSNNQDNQHEDLDYLDTDKLDLEVSGDVRDMPHHPYGPKRHLSKAAATDTSVYPIQLTPGQDPIGYFTANNLPFLGIQYKGSNNVSMSSGFVEVTYGAERLSRIGLALALLNEKAPDDWESIGAKTIFARGFRLEPYGWSWGVGKWEVGNEEIEIDKLNRTNKGNILAVSGEPFPAEPVTVEIHPKIINIITATWLKE